MTKNHFHVQFAGVACSSIYDCWFFVNNTKFYIVIYRPCIFHWSPLPPLFFLPFLKKNTTGTSDKSFLSKNKCMWEWNQPNKMGMTQKYFSHYPYIFFPFCHATMHTTKFFTCKFISLFTLTINVQLTNSIGLPTMQCNDHYKNCSVKTTFKWSFRVQSLLPSEYCM